MEIKATKIVLVEPFLLLIDSILYLLESKKPFATNI